jgi:hypothetical protein
MVIACAPILPLVRIFGGPNLLMQSVAWLVAAVALKSLAFAAFERRLPRWRAALYMLWGNFISTLVGFLLGLGVASPLSIPFVLPAVYAVARTPARRVRFHAAFRAFAGVGPDRLAAGVAALYLASILLFGIAQKALEPPPDLASYWIGKLLYVEVAVFVGMILTTLWEEWAIAGVAGGPDETSYLPAAARANAVTFLAITLCAALRTIPERLQASDFLIGLLG